MPTTGTTLARSTNSGDMDHPPTRLRGSQSHHSVDANSTLFGFRNVCVTSQETKMQASRYPLLGRENDIAGFQIRSHVLAWRQEPAFQAYLTSVGPEASGCR